jgi:hypothetical protein
MLPSGVTTATARCPALTSTATTGACRLILSGYPGGRDDLAAAVAARMDRQAILHDDTKHP